MAIDRRLVERSGIIGRIRNLSNDVIILVHDDSSAGLLKDSYKIVPRMPLISIGEMKRSFKFVTP